MSCVMDFPTAWAFTRASAIKDHDVQCSWYTHNMLCDCRVLNDEYDRLEARFEALVGVSRSVTTEEGS